MSRQAAHSALPPPGLPYQALPVLNATASFSMLAGVRVLDLTTSVAGPYATMLLSDFGAEVIKVERPDGDDARHWGPPFLDGQALWFTAVNRNKKSVVLDLLSKEGFSDLQRLIASADVVVTNQPLSVQKKLKLDYESLREQKPDIIFVSVTGFGLSGERAELTCYDLIAEGYSGIMDITGEEGGSPQKVGAPAADMLAGQDAAMATMAALFDKQKSGQGRKIDISLVESMTRFLSCRISSYLGSGEVPKRSGGTDSVIAIYQAFETADRPLTLGIGSDRIWKRFWEAVGDPEFAHQKGFESNAARRIVRSKIVKHIQNLLLKRTRAEWLKIFASARVPAGPINAVDEVVADQALQDRGMFYGLIDGQGRVVPQIGLGIQIDDKFSIPASAPPRLGEHTQEVLSALAPAVKR
ncbi:CoA transferase [Falsochrobactrum shanghaiense]|uniref:CoA transferase n=1 Tax=Falsochrobactrum shanghaiense TaxID=2201899 RepID=A0A316JMP8_9HYPH|nr:CoA transferase [Falsochrobactrum shanghaiense]